MKTKIEEIAAKARKEPKLKFSSICHHVTRERVWQNLNHITSKSAKGIDGIDLKEAKATFEQWIEEMMGKVHRKGYKAPPVRRVWVPKPGKIEKRPIGVPCIADRALQRSVVEVLTGIYEQDFLGSSFGGRQGLSAHHALSTFNQVVVSKQVGWVLEADIKNFFGSINHEWMIKFVQERVIDPRIIKLIQKWQRAGEIEEGRLEETKVGTPQGGSIRVLLSNVYMHYVLDLWYEKAVKPRLQGEAYLIRYIDDFLVCFQYQTDAIRFKEVLAKRLDKFGLALEMNKTRLDEFGRYAQKEARKQDKKVEVINFLGITHYCTRNRKGSFLVGRKTEKTRLKRSITKVGEIMRIKRHYTLQEQTKEINEYLRGHYSYYGHGGNYRSLQRVYRITERYWQRMLSSRSHRGYIKWEKFEQIKGQYPLEKPKLRLTYAGMQKIAML